MNKTLISFLIFVFTLPTATLAGEMAPQSVVDLANSTLSKLGTNPAIVAAVKAQNEKNLSIDEIKETDKKWQAHVGIADYMSAIMESECGKALRDIQKSAPYYSEIFVMDNQGANVAMTDKTSDYWQGDEDKFIKSYNEGNGAVFIDEVKFDASAQAYLVQVSVPVKDGKNVIGAITIGIDVDKIE
ncbi:MAG: cache domain-containing protein [Deltaproteobacteria bacterium]|nr:cache domain-containing protein [Deltaproteobacteria bacterium]